MTQEAMSILAAEVRVQNEIIANLRDNLCVVQLENLDLMEKLAALEEMNPFGWKAVGKETKVVFTIYADQDGLTGPTGFPASHYDITPFYTVPTDKPGFKCGLDVMGGS